MQCFDTFCGLLHKLYAATMDGKGREGTYNFFLRRLEGSRGQGIGLRGPAAPLPLRWRRPCRLDDISMIKWVKAKVHFTRHKLTAGQLNEQ